MYCVILICVTHTHARTNTSEWHWKRSHLNAIQLLFIGVLSDFHTFCAFLFSSFTLLPILDVRFLFYFYRLENFLAIRKMVAKMRPHPQILSATFSRFKWIRNKNTRKKRNENKNKRLNFKKRNSTISKMKRTQMHTRTYSFLGSVICFGSHKSFSQSNRKRIEVVRWEDKSRGIISRTIWARRVFVYYVCLCLTTV